MSNKKNNNNNSKFPFANEIQQMKHEFKSLIDSMSDDEFLDLVSFLAFSSDDFEDGDWCFDEDWEDEAEKFYKKSKNISNNLNFNNDELPF